MAVYLFIKAPKSEFESFFCSRSGLVKGEVVFPALQKVSRSQINQYWMIKEGCRC